MKHKHADLMLMYAQDALYTDTPWLRWEEKRRGCDWANVVSHPLWIHDYEYRRKPQKVKAWQWVMQDRVTQEVFITEEFYHDAETEQDDHTLIVLGKAIWTEVEIEVNNG